ncbi:hypothetical protein X797_011442 [Metarhizium robertsii]|uniref:Uncharacterized protein n=1 Tax=Metarhizium robertsii TaxID=568076 RepID=A0A014N6W6_9HYPO|nr:hypothetical protein X797_011442 [Metarhizium robertsii]
MKEDYELPKKYPLFGSPKPAFTRIPCLSAFAALACPYDNIMTFIRECALCIMTVPIPRDANGAVSAGRHDAIPKDECFTAGMEVAFSDRLLQCNAKVYTATHHKYLPTIQYIRPQRVTLEIRRHSLYMASTWTTAPSILQTDLVPCRAHASSVQNVYVDSRVRAEKAIPSTWTTSLSNVPPLDAPWTEKTSFFKRGSSSAKDALATQTRRTSATHDQIGREHFPTRRTMLTQDPGENHDQFDPLFRWTWREEFWLVRKLDVYVMAWACIMFMALELDRAVPDGELVSREERLV